MKKYAEAATPLDAKSKELRRTIIKTLESSGRGHVGSAFSAVEIIRVLYDDVMRYDPNNPGWSKRDRFILSKGHGCLALYVTLADQGFFPQSELWKFCGDDGLLGGHPEITIPGVEASTGSLGHGMSIGIGFAINAKYEKLDHRIFVLIGDGESNEGSIWEGALSASKHKLSNLTVIIDYNKHQSYGSTLEVQDLEPLADKWRAFGFHVKEANGHDVTEIRSVLREDPDNGNLPTAVICHTIKGKGIGFVENNMDWHHKNRVSPEEAENLLTALDNY